MLIPRFTLTMFSIGIAVLIAGSATAQDYPSKTIRIVTSGAGGGSDFGARLIAQGIAGALGQPIIVENRPVNLTGEIVAKAPPDGYTLLFSGSSLWVLPLLQDAPYDPVKDFLPIALTDKSPNIVVVHPSLQVKSVNELIALAKARPGELNYAAASAATRLAAELFNAMAGVNIAHVPYKSMGMALTDMLGGYVTLVMSSTVVAPHLKSGRLRALGVTSLEPSALFPGIPTVAATIPGYEAVGVSALLAPARTPDAIINRVNQEVVRFLKTAEAREKLLTAGTEVVGSSPQQLGAEIKADMAKLSKVIKDAGIRGN